MESKTIGKVLGAFLAGVLLALGGAIFYSRHAPISGPAALSEAARTPVQSASAAPKLSTTATPEPPDDREARVSREPAGSQTPTPVSRPKADSSQPTPKHQSPMAEMRRPANQADSTLAESEKLPAAVVYPPPPASAQQNPTTPVTNPADASQSQPTAHLQDSPVQQQPHVVTLPAGTNITVRLRETLTSDRNGTGDTFQASLDAPVIVDGFIIADRQSKVIGRVTQATGAGRVKGQANLTLALSAINTTDGQQVSVETDSYEKWGNSSVKGDTAKVAGAAALGAIIGAIAGGGKGAAIGAGAGGAAGTGVALGTRGASASIPSESIITFRLTRPVTITEKFN